MVDENGRPSGKVPITGQTFTRFPVSYAPEGSPSISLPMSLFWPRPLWVVQRLRQREEGKMSLPSWEGRGPIRQEESEKASGWVGSKMDRFLSFSGPPSFPPFFLSLSFTTFLGLRSIWVTRDEWRHSAPWRAGSRRDLTL